MLNDRVRLLASHLRNAMEYITKLQNQTVTVQYERETMQDRWVKMAVGLRTRHS